MIVYSAQILSGTILIWSLAKIREFQLAHPETGQEFNMRTMLLHAAAFGLIIVSVAIYLVFYLNNLIKTTTGKAKTRTYFEFVGSYLFLSLCSFLS